MSLSFFFNDTATTEIYTLSLHDALPISTSPDASGHTGTIFGAPARPHHSARPGGPFRQSAGSPAPARGDRAGVVERTSSGRAVPRKFDFGTRARPAGLCAGSPDVCESPPAAATRR